MEENEKLKKENESLKNEIERLRGQLAEEKAKTSKPMEGSSSGSSSGTTPFKMKCRVVDLTRVLAGPYCSMILSDLGAEIIKVEKKDGGDDSRQFGPFRNDVSMYYVNLNRGKR